MICLALIDLILFSFDAVRAGEGAAATEHRMEAGRIFREDAENAGGRNGLVRRLVWLVRAAAMVFGS